MMDHFFVRDKVKLEILLPWSRGHSDVIPPNLLTSHMFQLLLLRFDTCLVYRLVLSPFCAGVSLINWTSYLITEVRFSSIVVHIVGTARSTLHKKDQMISDFE